MKQIGLYFGSFNPIHIGHLIIAEYMVENSDLEEIWFVLSPNNPHKNQNQLLNEKQRYYMLQLAVEDDARFRPSDVEFRLPRPSYTYVTLETLVAQYPQYQFSIIMGEDNLNSLHKWKNYTYLTENFKIYVYPRTDENEAKSPKIEADISVIPAPKIDISSSLIRKLVKEKKLPNYMLPSKVARFIDEMNLYR